MDKMLKQIATKVVLSKQSFAIAQRLGISIVRTKESPIPNLGQFTYHDRRYPLAGIDMNDKAQLEFLPLFKNYKYLAEEFRSPKGQFDFRVPNDSFGYISAVVLRAFLSLCSPRRIIEVGAGNSTLVTAGFVQHAPLVKQPRFTIIEPYPKGVATYQIPGVHERVCKQLEEVELSLFESLDANDILFIDGSHYVKAGGDVNYAVLEILPRLQSGVIVHFHDVFLPFDYPKAWIVQDRTFYTEQYLLQAFLYGNSLYEILWAERYMKDKYPGLMQNAFTLIEEKWNHNSNSLWIRKR
ncbi:MAG: class I SAM-dependent methyltransferase [Chloroflexi bacterium]|nr:class I SAM-dependent methyltransferase [Chloroflexota bacterium]